MEKDFNKVISRFLETIKNHASANPVFSVDYNKEQIILKDAPSGFLKKLYDDDRLCGHLTDKGIIITYFSL